MTIPTDLYIGKREAVMAEVGTLPIYEGKYLAQLLGNAQWDAEGFSTLKDCRIHVEQIRAAYPGIRICWI